MSGTRHPRARTARRRRVLAATAVAAPLLVLLSPLIAGRAAASTSLAGSAGTTVTLPTTDSAVTVAGHGAYAGLKVTVNQTQDLVNQAISVAWTGASPTFSNGQPGSFSGTFSGDYLQIFECWGDPQSSDPPDPGDPGPLPSQCEFGGESPNPTTAYPISTTGWEYSRVLTQQGWSTDQPPAQLTCPVTTDADRACYTDPSTGFVVQPFEAVDGTIVDQQMNYGYVVNGANAPLWLNPDFSFDTTNEIDFARTEPDGDGQQLFQVDTGLESQGLGCGQSVQPTAGGGTKVPQCWLVVVPRGTPAEEDPSGVGNTDNVVTSPLTPEAWANRIAIPLQFNPVGSSCGIGAESTQIAGSELAGPAMTSWEEGLCDQPGSPSYSYTEFSDDQARQNLVTPTFGSAGMSVMSDPVDADQVSPANPVVYAPLTLSGATIAFNIERVPAIVDGQRQPDELPLSGEHVTQLNLTPRLVAKLLTESYQGQLPSIVDDTSSSYQWIQHNPVSLLSDPDFLQYNPEFSLLTTDSALDAGTLLVEEASSDVAKELWTWVLGDPEARAWLEGTPDPWGMKVNPYYTAALEDGTPGNFPKADPYCENTGDVVGLPPQPVRPLCEQDWSPYAASMQAAAQSAANATDGAKTTLNLAGTPDSAWGSNAPQETGYDCILTVTDTASAARYGLQTASLSPSGDDTASRPFVAPTTSTMTAGEAAMTQSDVPGVLQSDPSSTAPGAYPLTMLTYAATTPVSLPSTSRVQYADFITYASGQGQTAGLLEGQLPEGYVPLPAALRYQAAVAVGEILNPPSPPASGAGGAQADGFGDLGSLEAGSLTSSVLPATAGAGSSRAGKSPTPRSFGPAALARLLTHGLFVGMLRWALPIVLFIAAGAALAAALLRRHERRLAALLGQAVPPGGPAP